jgi:hypothetical protein
MIRGDYCTAKCILPKFATEVYVGYPLILKDRKHIKEIQWGQVHLRLYNRAPSTMEEKTKVLNSL